MSDDRDELAKMIADGVPLDAKERYAFQLAGTMLLIVPIRCKCRPNQFLQIFGVGARVTCDHCGFTYWIHQVVFNAEDPDPSRRTELGVAIGQEAPKIARPRFPATES